MSTIIIAEIGVNHNADLQLAKKMIREAAMLGVDVIKFQTAIPELVQTAQAPMAEYQVNNTGEKESQLEMSRKFHFPLKVFPLLKAEVEKYGKIFMSTAFDLKSFDCLVEMGVQDHKIPSGELTNLPYLRAIGSRAKRVLISTGMATWGEVQDAIQVLIECGLEKQQLTLLQCNTEYPTPFEDVNLRAMLWMGEKMGVEYGYSDHTTGIEVALAAVALGAVVIEKHFTTDKCLPGPDQRASLDPVEFKSLVNGIRNIEKAMGSSEKKPSPSEIRNKFVVRRSVYTLSNIGKGDVLTMDNLIVLRPEAGLSPMKIDQVLGKKTKLDLPAQHPISIDDVE